MGCGIFGMNLTSGLESSPVAFLTAVSTVGVTAATVFTLLLRRMRRVQRGIRS